MLRFFVPLFASIAFLVPPAQGQEQSDKVQYLPAEDLSPSGARLVAANASRDKVAIIIWGGNRALQQEVYNAARDLSNIGIRVAFVVGPDTNGLTGDAYMQVYACSRPVSSAHYGTDYAHEVRQDMRQGALEAYRAWIDTDCHPPEDWGS